VRSVARAGSEMEQRQVAAQLCVLPTQRLDFLIGALREFCRAWPNQSAVTVKGAHFLPEDSPEEVGSARASLSPSCQLVKSD
jgi:hypothetical protein